MEARQRAISSSAQIGIQMREKRATPPQKESEPSHAHMLNIALKQPTIFRENQTLTFLWNSASREW